MKVCNEVKRLIDEADQPDLIGFQASNHISSCADCKSFADERVALRKLLASGERVSAPVNFDAMLTARIAEARAERTWSWLSGSSLMRLGAATAAVVVAVFAAQYSDLFSDGNHVAQPQPPATTATNTPPVPLPKSVDLSPAQRDVNGYSNINPTRSHTVAIIAQRSYSRRSGQTANTRVMPEDYSSLQEGGVVLVRGPNGEREVPMPTVSVGAQPLFYSRQSQPVRNIATSF